MFVTTNDRTRGAETRRAVKNAHRRGITSVLAMLYLMIFSSLALGFYAQTNMSAQVSGNERRRYEAQVATESAVQFIRHQLSAVNIPPGLTGTAAFEELYMQLAGRLEGTPNLGTKVLGYTAAAGATPASIRIPDTGLISLNTSGSRGFRAVITNTGSGLDVKFVGSAGSGQISRAISMQFQRAPKPYVLVGINSLTLGGTAFTDSYNATKGAYSAATAKSGGSIGSNGNITLTDTAKVNGDIRFGTASMLNIAPGATVNGISAVISTPAAYPSVTLPPAGTYTDVGDITSSSGTSTYPGGTYLINRLTLSGTAKIIWSGPVKLYIRTSYNVSGDVVIQTYNNLPINRCLYFLPTCTTATWTGTNVCVGDLYAPDTAFTVSGSVQKMGRIIAKTINNTSSGGMHYDESLTSQNAAVSYVPMRDTYLEVAP